MPSIDPIIRIIPYLSPEQGGGILYFVVAFLGLNLSVWGTISLIRFFIELIGRIPGIRFFVRPLLPRRAMHKLTPEQVAVLMPAYNEELVIAKSIESLLRIVPAQNVYIVSDGSKDNTAAIARSMQVNVIEPPNQGKAGALKTGIDHFKLAERYAAVLLVDADTIISQDYLTYALPYLEDPKVAVVAGFARTLWEPHTTKFWNLFFLAYRDRAYVLFQYMLKYGQAWKPLSVTHIVPGFCSLYRASILKYIDIAAPGLVIEDYNMTFEVHRHKLGKIIIDPRVYGNTQDPDNIVDYYKQIRRWHLGLWQTIRRHGFWASLFSVVLLMYMAEVILAAISLLCVPLIMLFIVIMASVGQAHVAPWMADLYAYFTGPFNIVKSLAVFFAVDYSISLVMSVLLRRPQYLWYGLGFGFMRFIDTWVFLMTLPRAFLEHSTGAWVSPTRRSIASSS